jgi:phosphoglycolate phosphatase-like HAD superfamily hydrolase
MKKLVIFDIDGTITNTNAADHAAFEKAYADLYELDVTDMPWEDCENYTDTGIAQHIFMEKIGRTCGPVDIRKIKNKVYDNLFELYNKEESMFAEVKGASDFIEFLKTRNEICLAIATGCWEHTANFKLNVSGIDYEELPMGNSDHAISRVGITNHVIELAKKQYGLSKFDEIVYFGDGAWDVKTTDAMGIRLIGVDCNNSGRLKELGVKNIIKDYSNQEAVFNLI